MMLKFPRTNRLADRLIERNWPMYDEIPSKSCIKMKKVINREKRSKTLNKVKPVKNINKNMHSFQRYILHKRKLFLHINCKTMHMRILSD